MLLPTAAAPACVPTNARGSPALCPRQHPRFLFCWFQPFCRLAGVK